MYLLDSNVFIEAHRRYYGMDFVPGFWDWLDRAFGMGLVASIERIKLALAGAPVRRGPSARKPAKCTKNGAVTV